VILLWTSFLICSLAILYSGTKLSKYGDIIAEKTGLGGLWIGVILIAFVTSLPELITGLSSVIIFKTPDIAAGDVIGSCVFNIFILALLDTLYRSSPISSKGQRGHILSAGFGILLLCIIAVNIFLSTMYTGFPNAIGHIGLYSPVIIILYVISMRLIFSYEKKNSANFNKEAAQGLRYEQISKGEVYINFTINALVVVTAAVFLPEIGKKIAEVTGLGQTFVGNILIAISTSLPEVVVSTAAVKIGASDMAIGNLLGSNVFNTAILAIDDLFFLNGPILSLVEPIHIIPVISAIIMTTIAIIGLTYRASKKYFFLSWDAMAIIMVYILNMVILYTIK
jgi:cation:H+ antiporter